MDIKGICISSTVDEHGSIYVYETRTSRILSFDGKIYQSSMKLNNVNGLHLVYTQAMMAGLFFIPTIKTATVMGFGAGSMVKSLLHSFASLDVHAVEYRQGVAKIAKEYFYLPNSDRMFIHIDDAMGYMKNTEIKSDIIFSDLFNAQGMEPQQVQSSYLRDCKNALNNQGVLVLNIWNSAFKTRKELDSLLEFENKLIRFNVETGNTIVLAFKNDIPVMTKETLFAKGAWLEEKMNMPMDGFAQLIWDAKKLS